MSAPFGTVLAELTGMLVEVIGEDFLMDVEVSSETTFNEDLALESIEFVALAEKLQERYGEQVDFPAFLAGLDIEEIMALTVGELVTYVTGCLAPPASQPAGGSGILELRRLQPQPYELAPEPGSDGAPGPDGAETG